MKIIISSILFALTIVIISADSSYSSRTGSGWTFTKIETIAAKTASANPWEMSNSDLPCYFTSAITDFNANSVSLYMLSADEYEKFPNDFTPIANLSIIEVGEDSVVDCVEIDSTDVGTSQDLTLIAVNESDQQTSITWSARCSKTNSDCSVASLSAPSDFFLNAFGEIDQASPKTLNINVPSKDIKISNELNEE